jgi:hypothetical protein
VKERDLKEQARMNEMDDAGLKGEPMHPRSVLETNDIENV